MIVRHKFISSICFQEETIGVDCITHGRYGYIDPAGEHRHGWPHTRGGARGGQRGVRGDFKQCNLVVSQSQVLGEASRVPREYSYTSGIRCDPDTRKVTSIISTKCGAGLLMLAAHDVYLLPLAAARC